MYLPPDSAVVMEIVRDREAEQASQPLPEPRPAPPRYASIEEMQAFVSSTKGA